MLNLFKKQKQQNRERTTYKADVYHIENNMILDTQEFNTEKEAQNWVNGYKVNPFVDGFTSKVISYY